LKYFHKLERLLIWFALFRDKINNHFSTLSHKTITSIISHSFNVVKSIVFQSSLLITNQVNWLFIFTSIFFFSILIILPVITSPSLGYLISGDAFSNSSNRVSPVFFAIMG